jgi:hypothetical protein
MHWTRRAPTLRLGAAEVFECRFRRAQLIACAKGISRQQSASLNTAANLFDFRALTLKAAVRTDWPELNSYLRVSRSIPVLADRRRTDSRRVLDAMKTRSGRHGLEAAAHGWTNGTSGPTYRYHSSGSRRRCTAAQKSTWKGNGGDQTCTSESEPPVARRFASEDQASAVTAPLCAGIG